MRRVILSCLVFLLILLAVHESNASTLNNTGITGLWEYPTAEMPEDGIGTFGYTKASPYGYYFIDLAWLPWLEVNTRLTTFNTRKVFGDHGRRYMDKAMDLKAVLWHTKNPEYWFIPSIAIGGYDIMGGTELMKATFSVATWRVGNVAASVGYGSDRLNGVFGGLEWDANKWLTLKAEYSPLDYKHDNVIRAKDLPSEEQDKYNYGVVLKAPWGMEGSASYQRGHEYVFGISQRINLKRSIVNNAPKIYESPGYPRIAEWQDTDSDAVIAQLKEGFEQFLRVRDVDIRLDRTEEGCTLTVSYENYGYASHAEAMTRVLIVLSAIMPETNELVLIHKNAGVPVVKAVFPGCLLFDIRAHSLREEKDTIHSAVFTWASADVENPDANFMKHKAQHEFKTMLVYEPRIDQTLKETYMDRADIDLIYKGRYYNGWGSIFDVRVPFYNNVDTSDYSGLWWEKDLNDEIRIQQAGMTYANSIGSSGQAWIFGEGGYLDEEWFGSNIWARLYSPSGVFWAGGRLTALHDRDPYSFGGLTDGRLRYYYGQAIDWTGGNDDDWRFAQWVQAGVNVPGINMDIQWDYGTYADHDRGYKIAVTRHWDDAAIGFWMIDTEKNAPDKDFSRAGVHMEIPAERWFGSWFGNSSSHIWEQDTMLLSSWRMESAREGGKIRTPERLMGQLRPVAMKMNVEMLLRDYCSYDEDGEESVRSDKEVKSILGYLLKQ